MSEKWSVRIGNWLLCAKFYTKDDSDNPLSKTTWGHWVELEASGEWIASVRATLQKGKVTVYVRDGVPVEFIPDEQALP